MHRAFVKSVLREHAQRHLPGPPDLWPAIQAQIGANERPPIAAISPRIQPGRVHVPRGRSLLVSGLLGCLLVAVVLGALQFPKSATEPLAVSAAEVLARADAAAGPGSTIRSTHMTLTVRYRNNPTDPFTEGQGEWWDEAPGKSRTVSTYRGPDSTTAHFLFGSDGAIRYMYSDSDHEFRLYPADTAAATDLASATQQASRVADTKVYDAVLVGTEMVGTRPAYVLELTVKAGLNDTKTQITPFQQRKKVWIDQQAYLVLREQDWEAAGNLVYEMQYQHLDINPTLDPALFTPAPPANAIVADMRPRTAAEVAAGWSDAAGQLAMPLFQATKYPDWMVPGQPYYASGQGIVSQAFVREPDKQGGILSMVISQGPPGAASLSAPEWGVGQGVQIGTLSGRIYSKRQAYILIFDRDGTRIKIYLPAVAVVTSGQLRQIAQSLQPLPR